jgi:Domain of unknown function (DUF3471)
MKTLSRLFAFLFIMGLVAQPATARQEAAPDSTEFIMSADELEEYVGEYELAPGFVLAITVTEEGKIFGQATGQGAAEIFPSETDEFFYKIVDAQLSFSRDEGGMIDSLTLHQGGQNIPGKKIN